MAIVAGVLVWQSGEKDAQNLAVPRPIQITVNAQGYSDECTKIPVAITGRSTSGDSVDTVGFVDASGAGVELVPGDYELSFPASPLTPDGILYVVPAAPVPLIVPRDSAEGAAIALPETPAFSKSTALDQTDEMINTAYDYAIMDEAQAQRAEYLKNVAVSRHNEAVDSKQRADALAARTIDMPYYSIVIPEYWVGKVDAIRDGNDLTIVPEGKGTDAAIMEVELVPASQEVLGGDIGGGMLKNISTSGGYRAELWLMHNWPYYVGISSSSIKIPDSTLNTCIQLQTGGTVDLQMARSSANKRGGGSSGNGKYWMTAGHYIEDNVIVNPK